MLSQRLRRAATACVAATAGLMIAGPPSLARGTVPSSRYPLRVVVLDVGQGDATLVSLPGGRALLVDAGGVASYSSLAGDDVPGFDVGERVVLPALRAVGVSRLHALVVTHGDPDHVLGAPAVLRAREVSSVWEGVPVPPHAGLRDLRRQAAGDGIAWRIVQAGDRDWFGEVEVRVLHPPPPDWERQRIRIRTRSCWSCGSGRSIVLRVMSEGRRARDLSRLEPPSRGAEAGHHGSATSSTRNCWPR